MSLKDRLNTQQQTKTTETKIKKVQEEPQYYESSDIANSGASLDVIDILLADDELNAIYVNGAKSIHIEKKGKINKSSSVFADNNCLKNIIKKISLNKGCKADDLFIKFNYDKGVNITATLPPLSDSVTMFIKCYKDKFANLQTLQNENSISKEIALFFEALMSMKSNIIIAGEKNTLKTTLLSSLIKQIPNNSRAFLIDDYNEIDTKNNNISSFNFSNVDNKQAKKEILTSIVNSKPDRIFLNDCDTETLNYILKVILNGFEGAIFTIEAKTKEEALEKIISSAQNDIANQTKTAISQNINFIIFTKLINNRRIVSNISQIICDENNNLQIEDIFFLNNSNQHQSNGVTPEFLKKTELISSCLNSNIFDKQYTHTYSQIINSATKENTAISGLDKLKKLKKDYSQNQDEEAIKHAHEKINMLRKNIQSTNQEEIAFEQDDNTQNL